MKDCDIPEFQNSFEHFLERFRKVLTLAPCVRSLSINDRFFKRAVQLLTFKEKANSGLGYSSKGGHGSGISGKLSIQLTESAIEIANAGIKDPEIFALMPIIEEGIGSDRVSDMIISILYADFINYTARMVTDLGITQHLEEFKHKTEIIKLPSYKGKPIIFIPSKFLCKLPQASSWREIDDVCNYNQQIRNKICTELGIDWKDRTTVKKHQLKSPLLSDKALLKDVLDYYKELKGVPYDFRSDKDGEYISAVIGEYSFPSDLLPFKPIKNLDNVISITQKICSKYKSLIENNRMYDLIIGENGKYSETKAQHLFFCIAQSYCEANNIDLTRECDAGAGELDFKLSSGARSKVLIEMKLSSNSGLKKGFYNQLSAYLKAESSNYGVCLILIDKKCDQNRVANLKSQAINEGLIEGEHREIISIDAFYKPSASKLN